MFSRIQPGLTEEQVKQAVEDSVALARRRDSEFDYRAAVRVHVTPREVNGAPARIFTAGGASPDPLLQLDGDDGKHFAEMDGGHLGIVQNLLDFRARGLARGDKILVDWLAQDVATIIHEIGHNLTLRDAASPGDNIMISGGGAARKTLVRDQARAFSGLSEN